MQRASAWFAAGALGIAVLIVADARADEAPYSRARAGRVRALAERVAKEVVLVEVVRAAAGSLVKELRFDGGGFHAGQGRIVTSAFLLEKAERVRVQLPDGQWHDAKVTKSKPELGLAVLFVEAAKSMPAPEIARASPVPVLGQAVFLSTRPTSGEPAVTMGFWIDPPGRTYYGRTTLSARNGHPLFDEWGHVCALALLPARPAGGGLVAPSWALRRFLDLPTQTKEELAAEKDPLRDEFPLPTRTVTGKPAVFD